MPELIFWHAVSTLGLIGVLFCIWITAVLIEPRRKP